MSRLVLRLVPALLVACLAVAAARSEEPAETAPASGGPVPLNKEGTVLLDAKNKRLTVKSEVVLREGLLEMLLCKRHSKEHESILAFDGNAYVLHAGLVALGAEPGKPVSFTPEFVPPTGQALKIELVWTDEAGKTRREDARKWVRRSVNRFFGAPLEKLSAGVTIPEDGELRYDPTNKELSWYGPMTDEQRDRLLALSQDETFRKAIRSFYNRTRLRPMEADWVFAGSGFVVDEDTGHKAYLAESGDVICVANFPSATIDVGVRSQAEGQDNLLFEAWTDRIPPIGTAVLIEISPVAEKPAGGPPDDQPSGKGQGREQPDRTGAGRSVE